MAGATDPGVPSLPSEDRGRTRRSASAARRFSVHAWVTGETSIGIVLIWAFTGAGDFWPVWVLLPLAYMLALHAWVRWLRRHAASWRAPRMTFALAVHGGVWLATACFLTGIWGAAGGGRFWAAWPVLGLAVPLAIHASVVFLTAPVHHELNERIDVLTTTRAGAVDAQEDQLRRIERDLHDGAQARLVALGMSLGMAEQKLDAAEPARARELLAEARTGAEQALRELRDLARGIHPPLLADRGLEAAVRSLADLSPMQVEVSVELGPRPAAAVESAAYFVCAEGLANAAKHSRAGRVQVRIARRGSLLRLEIVDDGLGGADGRGRGLQGLRSRVEALDGTFALASPPGGPTTLSAQLPCA
ncbi:MAG TPA: histidine kinase [Solirubrobacteraceae bacterium]|nr:histidine kinase [Solirubrobacteraceae bacterium]